MKIRSPIALVAAGVVLAGCAVQDSRIAERAQTRLIGMKEADLETCVGSPEQHSSFGDTDVVTYEFSSGSSTTWQLPLIQGPSFTNGGNCHMTVRFDDQIADNILYSGEKNDTGAPDAYCAPIVRSCLDRLDTLRHQKGSAAAGTAAPANGVKPPPS